MATIIEQKIIDGSRTYDLWITKNDKVTIITNGDFKTRKQFSIGDQAEYDSWNLSYYGKIVSITDKTVTIYDDSYDKNRRLTLRKFAFRNHNFDLDKVRASNSDTMMYI